MTATTTATTTALLGVRHHGPGSARAVRAALDQYEPGVVLIEGPPEADAVVALAADEGMRPPVALLAHAVDDPSRAGFWPFAEFSPEWAAIRWALARDVPVSFIDLPAAHSLAMREEEGDGPGEATTPDARVDPIAVLAETAGYDDPERWWEDAVEHRAAGDPLAAFEVLGAAMGALREAYGDGGHPQDAPREAYMRLRIREARRAHERVAVVCGAWHVPALAASTTATADRGLLKGLPKVKAEVTWVPWTHRRLSRASGYGAGIASPGWYRHLFTAPDRPVVRWMTKVAGLLREEDLPVSSAHVIEAVRLADTLAAMRGRPLAGLTETTDAVRAVMCDGSDVPLAVIRDRLIVGDVLGEVPDGAPAVPLARDLAREQRRLRLGPGRQVSVGEGAGSGACDRKAVGALPQTPSGGTPTSARAGGEGSDAVGALPQPSAGGTPTQHQAGGRHRPTTTPRARVPGGTPPAFGPGDPHPAPGWGRHATPWRPVGQAPKAEAAEREVELDLRKEIDSGRSRLLHRLRLLGIGWGELIPSRSGTGTFRETWRLRWEPELAVQVAEAGIWGTTVASAATARAEEAAVGARALAEVTGLAERCLLAGLPDALPTVMRVLADRAALDADVAHLAAALPALVRAVRYGDVRGTDSAALEEVARGLAERICVGLPPACGGLDPDGADEMRGHVRAVHHAVALLSDTALRERWTAVLRGLAQRERGVPGVLRGAAARLLVDEGRLEGEEAARLMGLALSPGTAPQDAAGWVEGFLAGGGMLLVHDERLLALVDGWLSSVPASAFDDVLPLLRRTFAEFEPGVRRTVGELVRRGTRTAPGAAETAGFGAGLDQGRADAVLPTLRLLLGEQELMA